MDKQSLTPVSIYDQIPTTTAKWTAGIHAHTTYMYMHYGGAAMWTGIHELYTHMLVDWVWWYGRATYRTCIIQRASGLASVGWEMYYGRAISRPIVHTQLVKCQLLEWGQSV